MKSIPEWLGAEEADLRTAGEIGARHGYGNVVSHLLREWQLLLMRGGVSEEAARLAVLDREPYPLDFHRPKATDNR